jgi:hypothetical protein
VKDKDFNSMKNYRYITFALVVLMGLTVSCKRSLENYPTSNLTLAYIFNPKDSAGTNAENFLINVYLYTPNGFFRVGAPSLNQSSGDLLDCADDDGITSAIGQPPVLLMETGGLTSFYNPDDGFLNPTTPNRDFYTGIRLASEFIDNIDVVPIKGVLADGTNRPIKAAWKAEARFLRAYFYFELLKRYGGIPLMGDQVRQLGDNVNIPRSSFAACVQYIVTELDSAQLHLRLDPVDAVNFGRISEGGAMALKSRVLLYAASPLFNGGNIDPSNNLTGYTDYEVSRWQQAAAAAQAVMNYGMFSLDTSYNDLFVSDRNPEQILVYSPVKTSTSIENTDGPPFLSGSYTNGLGRTSPTQELVDAFGTVNGEPITQDLIANDPTGYDPNNPFANRDPRFRQTIFYNGAIWLNQTLQMYDGGKNKPDNGSQETKTGYYLRKFMGNFQNVAGYNSLSTIYHNYILFRYGEILLNYAEAENEYESVPDQTVYNALIQLRKRAHIVAGTNNNYGLAPGMTQSQMRLVIQNERRVEMAFEEQRFWDIRRWKIADQVYNVPLHGYQIIKNQYTGDTTASVQPVLTTVFKSPQMYLYPIPYSQVVINPNMKQNPGW